MNTVTPNINQVKNIVRLKDTFDGIKAELNKIIVGQDEVLDEILIAILCDGNALLESYPGLGKTLMVKTIAQILDLQFSRIQNTPDLMPSDITGTYVIEEDKGHKVFRFQKGPIFANIILADEINRATPKTQAALLEAMQEKQVTMGNQTFQLERPFFVLATQNPIDMEGSLQFDEAVFVNGMLKTGKELLQEPQELLAEDKKGNKVYKSNAWTYALNAMGKIEKQSCFLYTVPYTEEFITFTTRTGRRITVTKNHPFLVNDRGFIQWRKAEELTKEDYLVQPAKLCNIPEKQVMSHEEALALMTQKPIPKEILFDENFAFWIAFLLSDGAIGEKYVEACQKNYPKALDRFVEISKNYGFTPGIRMRKGCIYARIYSKPLIEYLKIRFQVSGGKDKEIPSWFLSFPVSLNREFLKAFIALESCIRDNRITFTQKSKHNTNMIAYMLLREGIMSWTLHDRRVFRLKIQGEDTITYLQNIGWLSEEKAKRIDMARTVTSHFRVVPIDRVKLMRLVTLLGLNSFRTLKERKNLATRDWYPCYRNVKEGQTVIAAYALKKIVNDLREEMQQRKESGFLALKNTNPRMFAAGIGLPMTEIASQLAMSKNQIWNLYTTGSCTQEVLVHDFLQEQYSLRIAEGDVLLTYCEQLLSEDIFYDKIETITYVPSDGSAFGLTVPEVHNYIAGFGACGINHNTYPLPEAQVDRFLLKIKVDYPKIEEELEIVERYTKPEHQQMLKALLGKNSLKLLQQLTREVPIANDIKKRAVDIVTRTRKEKDLVEFGASPRASIALVLTAKARALIKGRKYVSEEDIEAMALPVLRHRLILSFKAERDGKTADDVIRQLLK